MLGRDRLERVVGWLLREVVGEEAVRVAEDTELRRRVRVPPRVPEDASRPENKLES